VVAEARNDGKAAAGKAGASVSRFHAVVLARREPRFTDKHRAVSPANVAAWLRGSAPFLLLATHRRTGKLAIALPCNPGGLRAAVREERTNIASWSAAPGATNIMRDALAAPGGTDWAADLKQHY
jgi:hypothetical protein